jgi:ribosomal protein S18 acetylase RimI-like enzyme
LTPIYRLCQMPSSLAWATHLDVLPVSAEIERRNGYTVVRSPSNPTHYFGNLLLFDDPPGAGDGARWEELFAAELGHDPRLHHCTLVWDRIDGDRGSAQGEFLERGYDLDDNIGLLAARGQLRPHPRENRDVEILTLDPDGDERLWEGVLDLQTENRDARHEESRYRAYSRRRLDDLREHFRAGRGAWYAAVRPDTGAVVASCGVVVTDGRGRFQAVDTAPAHRRRGIASRLVVEAGRRAEIQGADRLVIVAETTYHALGLYESLGFERREHVLGVWRVGREE